MEKIRKIIKENIKLIIGIILGLILSNVVVYAANTANINSQDVVYANATSGLTSTNVQSAIDEVNTKANNILNQKIIAWTYNQTEGASNYCVTGNESTCNKTECYKTKTVNSCTPGTIIDYLVNDNTRVRFHVIHDDGDTITMQSQRNTVYNIPGYIVSLGDTTRDITKGPLTILRALETATAGWSNVNDLTYTMGTTVFKNNAYTGCNPYNSCTENTYTMDERTAKARMITFQEANDPSIGCKPSIYSYVSQSDAPKDSSSGCPKWMNNYLYGTSGDNSVSYAYASLYNIVALHNLGYYTMSTSGSKKTENGYINSPWIIGVIDLDDRIAPHPAATMNKDWDFGARAVVEINKP